MDAAKNGNDRNTHHMKQRHTLISVLAAGVALCATNSRASLAFESVEPGSPGTSSQIQFSANSTFNFTDSSVAVTGLGTALGSADNFAQFQTSSADAANGLYGAFSGGPWTYGPITTTTTPFGTEETANVNASGGAFAIADGAGGFLTGDVSWVQVYTLGGSGGITAGGTINVTDLSYTADNNTALEALVNEASSGIMDVGFTFAPAHALDEFTSSSAASEATTFNGSLSVVPEPTTLITGALLLAPLGLGAMRILRGKSAI